MTEGAACPISGKLVDHNASRVTCFYTIAALAIVAVLGAAIDGFFLTALVLAWALVADYYIRAWTKAQSPMQRAGSSTARRLGVVNQPVDAAPKTFACQVGFFFAFGAAAMLLVSPVVGAAVAVALLAFNVLDGVFDFCVGCWMYTTLVGPWLKRT